MLAAADDARLIRHDHAPAEHERQDSAITEPSRPTAPAAATRRERRARAREAARRAHADRVVAEVTQAAQEDGGLTVHAEPGGRDAEVLLHLAGPTDDGAAARWARTSVWGAGVLALDLSGGFTLLEFEVDDETLPETAHEFVALAAEHLHGRSREVEALSSGGSRRRHLEITVDGELYRVPEPAEPLFGSCQEAALGLPRLLLTRLLRRRR